MGLKDATERDRLMQSYGQMTGPETMSDFVLSLFCQTVFSRQARATLSSIASSFMKLSPEHDRLMQEAVLRLKGGKPD
jgi:hypothetical protein